MNAAMRSAAPSVDLFGTRVHALSMDETVERVSAAIAERRPLLIGVVNAAKLVTMQRDGLLRESVHSADLTVADGASIVWATRLLGQAVPERVAGIDLMVRLLEQANAHGHRVYFLGARANVLAELLDRIRRNYPNLHIAGARDGYFTAEEEGAVARDIAASRPDLLFVGMSSPKKENFLARWRSHVGPCVCHGVGGSFDVLAGRVRRAPRAWQRCGMEWCYRLLQEPRRLWRRYLVTNCQFAGMLALAMAQRLVRRRGGAPELAAGPNRPRHNPTANQEAKAA